MGKAVLVPKKWDTETKDLRERGKSLTKTLADTVALQAQKGGECRVGARVMGGLSQGSSRPRAETCLFPLDLPEGGGED